MTSLFQSRRAIVLAAVIVVVGCVITGPASAQLGPPTGPSYGGSAPRSKKVVSGVAWHGVLQDGLDEAKRTGKPILFITAAPQCGGVPGMW
ncbi:MAG: hypothetical protein N2C14_13365 [Planctomycetales bacterium]